MEDKIKDPQALAKITVAIDREKEVWAESTYSERVCMSALPLTGVVTQNMDLATATNIFEDSFPFIPTKKQKKMPWRL